MTLAWHSTRCCMRIRSWNFGADWVRLAEKVLKEESKETIWASKTKGRLEVATLT